jgi:tetratricopeptide (TPR) repeat protein
MFEKAGNNNSAILYTQKAFDLAVKENNIMIEGAALNNLGNIYAKSGYSELAIKNYKNAIPFLIASENNTFLAESSLGLAIQYELKSEKDSALYYGNLSYDISRKNKFVDKQLDAGIFLADFYKKNSDIEKAFAFQEEAIVLKDSIYSKDRITKIQFLSAEEELRQKEIAEMKMEEELDRKIKLQYLFICIFIPVLFFFTLYLSNRKIRPKMIEFLGIVSLLLTFEFIMVLLHPFIADFTHHLPLYQLLIFAVIASILTPIHHRIEKLVLKILSGKDRVYLLKFRIQ